MREPNKDIKRYVDKKKETYSLWGKKWKHEVMRKEIEKVDVCENRYKWKIYIIRQEIQ